MCKDHPGIPLFKIIKEDSSPGTGRKKITTFKIALLEKTGTSFYHVNHLATIDMAEFLAVSYNIMIFQCVPKLINDERYIPIKSENSTYKPGSIDLAGKIKPYSQWTAEYYQNWYFDQSSSLTDKANQYEKYNNASKSNSTINVDASYEFAPGETITVSLNKSEIFYIASTCRYIIYKSEDVHDITAPWIHANIVQLQKLKTNSELYNYFIADYKKVFNIDGPNLQMIPYNPLNRSLTPIYRPEKLSDIFFICALIASSAEKIPCTICQYCGKAFVPNNKHKTIYCSKECRLQYRQNLSKTFLEKNHHYVESVIKTNIRDYTIKGSPNYHAGINTLNEWRRSAIKIKEKFINKLSLLESDINYFSPEKIESDFQKALIDEFKTIALTNHFFVIKWPKPYQNT